MNFTNFSYSSLKLSKDLTILQGIRSFLYAVTPSESSFAHISDVPDYLNDIIPLFIGAIILENALLFAMGLPRLRLNDAFSSVTAGMFMQITKVVVFSFEIAAYNYIYSNHRIASLPWDSPWTWYLCFLGVDFFYYWFHRATHDILSPDGLCNPNSNVFSAFPVYNALSILDSYGGRNPYCIDKNYGGTLIIWDRLFGTFQAEKPSEKIAYGLVHPVASWNPIWVQLSVLFKGPGWTPGQGRLGNPDDLPEIEYPIMKYDNSPTMWCNVYAILHAIIFQLVYVQLLSKHMTLSPINVWGVVLFLIFTMTSIGAQFDCKWYAPYMEFSRCLLFLLVDLLLSSKNISIAVVPQFSLTALRGVFLVSTFIWMLICVGQKNKEKMN